MKHFDEVAKIMKPKTRRQMTEEQKAAAVERLKQYWPAKGESAGTAARQGPEKAPESHPRTVPV